MNKKEAEKKICPFSISKLSFCFCQTDKCMAWTKYLGLSDGYCRLIKEKE